MALEVKDCRWPWNRLYVHVNGDIKPCCYATLPVGNIERGDDLDTVWRGAAMDEVRTYVAQNRIHKVCAGAGCAFIRSRRPDGADETSQAIYGHTPDGLVDEHTAGLARLGQKGALYRVGTALSEQGSPWRAAWWLRRAAAQGSELAAYSLGRLLLDTKVPFAEVAARSYFRKADAAGYAPAATQLAILLLEGRGGTADEAGAVKLLENAAERGDASAWHLLGLCQLDGVGGAVDADAGRRSLAMAARRGAEGAAMSLQAADEAPSDRAGLHRTIGYAHSAYHRGLAAREAGNGLSAYRWFRRAEKAGYVPATTQIGTIFLFGGWKPRRVFRPRGLERLVAAAQAGDPQAAMVLGTAHRNGIGTRQDVAAARAWFQQALAAGVVAAEQELARLPPG